MSDFPSYGDFIFPRRRLFEALRATTGRRYAPYLSRPFETALRHRLKQRDQDLDDYLRRLRRSPKEVLHLERKALVGVTSFFRSAHAFDALALQLTSYLSRPGHSRGGKLRIWVPACSTGQEAYSLAILVDALICEIQADFDYQVLATDICASAIEHAKRGCYDSRALASLTGYRRTDYFSDRCVIGRLRRRLSFKVHDLFDAAPVDTVDLISCRNLLIYLRPDYQADILELMAHHLTPSGLLFIGASENIPSENRDFSLLDRQHRIFRRSS